MKKTRKRRAKHKCHIAVMAINKKKITKNKKGQHFIHIVHSFVCVCVCVCVQFSSWQRRDQRKILERQPDVGCFIALCETKGDNFSHAKFGNEAEAGAHKLGWDKLELGRLIDTPQRNAGHLMLFFLLLLQFICCCCCCCCWGCRSCRSHHHQPSMRHNCAS